MKKFIFIILSFIWGITNIKAEYFSGTFYIKEYIPNIFVKKIGNDGTIQYKKGRILVDSINENYIYCLEPFENIQEGEIYNVYHENYSNILKIDGKTWERITLLAYYGYEYCDNLYNHLDKKWYYITQVLIWRTIDPSSNFYFTNTYQGNIDENLFKEEIAEIEYLIKMHEITPNLNIKYILLNDSITIKDSNEVLKNYEILNSTKVEASINENKLTIKATETGQGSITLIKNSNKYNRKPIIYISPNSQNILLSGDFSPEEKSYEIEIKTVNLKLVKIDALTKLSLKKEGIKFEIINKENGDYKIVSTNNEGIIDNIYLGVGKYIIKELEDQTILGYQVNKEPIEIEITGNSPLEITKYFENQPLLGNITIKKEGEILNLNNDNYTYSTKPLEGIIFGLYDAENKLIETLTTDNEGMLTYTNLLPGKYQIKELTAKEGYLINNEIYEINLILDPLTNKVINVTKIILNKLPKGNVEIYNYDCNNLPKKDTEYIIYNNEKKIIYSGITDEMGKIYLNDFPTGIFSLEEKNKNNNSYTFSLNNNETIIITETCTEIKVKIPNTEIEILKTDFNFVQFKREINFQKIKKINKYKLKRK